MWRHPSFYAITAKIFFSSVPRGRGSRGLLVASVKVHSNDSLWHRPPRLPGEGRDPLCATHGTELGGESPLRAARSGTASQRQLRRSDAGWGGSRRQIGEPTNRHRIQSLPLRRQGASAVGQPGNGRGRPILLLSRARVNPAAAPRKCSALPWETSSALRANRSRVSATASDGRGGVSRGHSSAHPWGRREGLNL